MITISVSIHLLFIAVALKKLTKHLYQINGCNTEFLQTNNPIHLLFIFNSMQLAPSCVSDINCGENKLGWLQNLYYSNIVAVFILLINLLLFIRYCCTITLTYAVALTVNLVNCKRLLIHAICNHSRISNKITALILFHNNQTVCTQIY